jgi:transposase
MGYEIRANYHQMYLMPPAMEDWIPINHPARFIRDFVGALDLRALGFRVPEAVNGRPPYAVDMLLGVWLYGYMNRIRQSRRLEKACWDSVSLIWLTGMNYPDHNTLWRFWVINKEVLKRVFKQSVRVAFKAGLVGLVLHALDGTKIAADVSRRGLWRREDLEERLRQLDVAVDEIMEETESAAGVEDGAGDYCLPPELHDIEARRQRIKQALSELDRVDRDYLHPVDSDARMMKTGDGFGLAYNAQVVVDGDSGLIVAEEVVNEEADNEQLVSMAEKVRDNLGVVAEETVADAGYYAPGELARAEKENIGVVVNLPERREKRWNKGEFQKSNFEYDSEKDVYICPLGGALTYQATRRKSHSKYFIRIYRCHHGRDCPRRDECSHDKQGRKIERGEHDWAVERQRQKQKDSTKRELLKKRKVIAEPVFGQIKEQAGVRRFSLRGLENVKAQWAMVCTSFNLRKLYRYWTAGKLRFA